VASRQGTGTLLRTNKPQRLKAHERENGRLKRLEADLSLDNAMLRETVSGLPGPLSGRAELPGKTMAGGAALEADIRRLLRTPGFPKDTGTGCQALGQPRSSRRYTPAARRRGRTSDREHRQFGEQVRPVRLLADHRPVPMGRVAGVNHKRM
jgi:hypothetical protein